MRARLTTISLLLCMAVVANASTLSRGHHNHNEKKHNSKSHHSSQDDSATTYDQVYAGDFDVKKEVQTDQVDNQMDVYVDKSY